VRPSTDRRKRPRSDRWTGALADRQIRNCRAQIWTRFVLLIGMKEPLLILKGQFGFAQITLE